MTMESINPATGEKLGEIEPTPTSKIVRLLTEARAAQREWSKLPYSVRGQTLRAFANLLVERKRTVAELISRENGKPLVEAYSSEIFPSLDIVNYYVARTRKILKSRRVKIGIPLLKTKKAFVRYEPYGAVAIISPWNYPLLLPLGQIVPALMAGNAVLFKPSEYTPLVGNLISEFMWEAGVPRSLLTLVQGKGDVGSALISAGPDKVFFTGSTATGKKVAEASAKNATPVSLELGSKDAMIVLEDADIDSVTSGALWGAFMNAGQTCISVERCFVHEKVFDSFIGLLQKKMKELKIGAGTDPDNEIGAIIHRAQYETITTQVNEAVKKGARIVEGGDFFERDGGYFVSPTLMVDVCMDSLLMTEETFGPVLPVIKFRDVAEAVELANASKFGLGASIWTADSKRGLQLARKISAGAVIVNDVVSYYGIADGLVGGVSESGAGRVHGREGILEMVSPKYYEVERAPRMKKLWWFNYDVNTLSFFEIAIDFLFSQKIYKRTSSLFKLAPKLLRMKKL